MNARYGSPKESGRRLVMTSLTLALTLTMACVEEEEASPETEQTAVDQVEELQTSIRDLEKEVAAKEAELDELRRQNRQLEQKRLTRYSVDAGQNHWQISFDFLTEDQGLSEDVAGRELSDAFLLHPVMEGFETWHFYDGETFGSFVTQDGAPVSPGDVIRTKEREAERAATRIRDQRQQIASLRRELESQETRLTMQLRRLEAELEARKTEVANLRSHIDTIDTHRERLAERLERLQAPLHSLYYLAGSEGRLRADGKIRGTFLDIGGLRLGNVQSEDFESQIDLRDSTELQLDAESFDLAHIDDVEILPGEWQEDRDYEITVANDGRSATVRFLNPDQFRLKTIVVVIES